jgi:hypothetical protein
MYAAGLCHVLLKWCPSCAILHLCCVPCCSNSCRAVPAGKRVVLAGAGLEHQQLVELATPMLKSKHLL